MAAPSEAEVRAQLKAAVDILDETRKYGNVNATNLVGLIDTFDQALESDFSDRMVAAVASLRRSIASTLDQGAAASIIRPHLQSYIKHIVGKGVPGGDNDAIDILYRYFLDNTFTVQTRSFTFNSASAGGANIGNNTVLRCTKDENNYDLEAATAEAKEFRCTKDRNTGANLDQEEFTIRGAPAGKDSLQFAGSNATRTINAKCYLDSVLRNTSFEEFSGTASAPTEILNWTSNVTVDSSKYTFDSTNYYRPMQNVTTPYALNIKATSTLTQKLSTFNTKLNPQVPYFMQIAYNRQVGAASGTLTLNMGAISNNVAIAAQTGWNILRVPSSQGQNNWYKSFDETDLDVVIDWSRTSGDLLIDDLIFAPMTLFDGTWYAVTANNTSHVPARKDDIYTWTDSEVGAVIQYWLFRAFGRYLPHSGSPTITDP